MDFNVVYRDERAHLETVSCLVGPSKVKSAPAASARDAICITAHGGCRYKRTPLHRRNERGTAPRAPPLCPLGEWKTITFVAALRHNKMTAPMVIEGAMNGKMFLAYVEQCLVPTLKCNDIVVADNFAAHKVAGIQEAIEKAGGNTALPAKYSPDLNPIEMPYSKFKEFLRKAAARTVPALYRAIRSFVPQLSARECANYFRHAGYVSI